MTSLVDIRTYQADDETAVLNLLQRSLAGGPTGDRTSKFFRWKHAQNPFGHSIALVATADQRIVGFRTFMRWQFELDGRQISAVRAVDTATHPDFQGRGIFKRLTLAAIAKLRSDNVDMIFNTPNERSLPGYLKMGWSEVGTLPIAIRPVRPLRFMQGLRHVTRGAPTAPLPTSPLPPARDALGDSSGVSALLREACHQQARLHTTRDIRYLRWRYADAPDLGYRSVIVRDRSGLAGLAIGRPRWRGSLVEFTLSELIVRRGDVSTARRLLARLKRSGCDHVATHQPRRSDAHKAIRHSGYLASRTTGILLVVNSLQKLPFDAGHPSSWSLSLGDLEVF